MIIEIGTKTNAKKVLDELTKCYWRFYKNELGDLFFIYTYYDDVGYEYNTLIPIKAKNSRTLKVKICKRYFERFMHGIFDHVIDDIRECIKDYINDIEKEVK
jgi:hypothetical protein